MMRLIGFVCAACLWTLCWTWDVTAAPPPAMKVEGVPQVSEELMTDLTRYAEYRTASFAAWHPAKREMLISTRFGNVPQLHTVAAPGAARTQITFFAEPVGGGEFQPKTGGFLAFTKDVGGAEFYQIFLLDTASGRTRMISDGKSRNGSVRWSPSGKQLAFTSTQRTGRDFDVYVMDPESPDSARLVMQAEGGRSLSTVDWSPDEAKIAVLDYRSITDSQLWLVDVATGGKQLLTAPPAQGETAVGAARFSQDGKGLYYTTDAGTEFQRIVYVSLADRTTREVAASRNGDVTAIALSPDGGRLLYETNELGASKLYLMEVKTGKQLPLPALPTGSIEGVEWLHDGNEIGFTSNNAQGGNAYSIDLKAGKLIQWTFSELGGLPAEELREPELLRWKSFDGLEISGFLYPAAARFAGRRPVIINIHGGPEGQSRPGFQANRNYFMNEMGVAMIYPNVRGSSGFGKTYVSLDNGRKREDSVKDIGALLDYVATRPDLDASRVMVYGGSYGGYMVLASMTHYNDRIRCAVDIVGISNWVTFLKNTQDYRRELRRAEYGNESDADMREFLERISPLNQAEKITKPLLVIQGKNDPRVPVTESVQLVEKIRANGGAVWYLEAGDEGHGFRKKNNRDFQFAAEVLFVRQHLLP
ncbi:MAG: prolyl oligopeptidase family serine peptidase [Bryobacterales bacterium]|nr:prolyl oligopeptidase family serine peptidase [Bryobacterales bacterium]